MSHHVGILAYGSLIKDPGREIAPRIDRRVQNALTPFSVEFARSSRIRDGAPTLVPVDRGGAQVNAQIMVIEDEVSVAEASNMLWRRETGNCCTGKPYRSRANPGPNTVLIKHLDNFEGTGMVLYTSIGSNITDPSPEVLAELAIGSACRGAGRERRDGISYLAEMHSLGIRTPLSSVYEQAILRRLDVDDLEAAWRAARRRS